MPFFPKNYENVHFLLVQGWQKSQILYNCFIWVHFCVSFYILSKCSRHELEEVSDKKLSLFVYQFLISTKNAEKASVRRESVNTAFLYWNMINVLYRQKSKIQNTINYSSQENYMSRFLFEGHFILHVENRPNTSIHLFF